MSWKTWCLLLGMLAGGTLWMRSPVAPGVVDGAAASRATDGRWRRDAETLVHPVDRDRAPDAGWHGDRSSKPPLAAPAATVAPAFHFERVIVSPVDHDWFPAQVEVGDVTGDGRADVVLVMNSTGAHAEAGWLRVRVHAQNADGTLAAPEEVAVERAINAGSSLVLMDLDGDRVAEIVVGDETGVTVIARHDGQYIQTPYAGDEARFLVALDADGDPYPDAYAQSRTLGASVYHGDGQGGFGRVTHVDTTIGYEFPKVADFTGDGLPDLLAGYIWVRPGTPDAGLASPFRIDISPLLSGTDNAYTVADVNQDGRPDLVVSDQGKGTDATPKGLRVLYRGAGNSFSDQVFFQMPDLYEVPGANAVADLDGNGYPDLVVMYNSNDGMGYALQGPSGFEPIMRINTDDNPWTNNFYREDSIVVADVNSDQCPDLVIAEVSSSLRIFYGHDCRAQPIRTGGPGQVLRG
jgi:hypothetical protein